MPAVIDKADAKTPDWQSLLEKPLDFFSEHEANGLLDLFKTDQAQGLSKDEAKHRLLSFGKNQQTKQGKVSALKIFFHQFQSSVVALLLLAAAASFMYHEALQAAGILLAVFINAITGFYMEFKAGNSLAALHALSGQSIRGIRGGENEDIDVVELVPGDLIVLEPGARVPADIRLIEAASLSVDESSLSGESVPVFKSSDSGAAVMSNIAFHGTLITAGRGKGIVIKTGSHSSLGKLGKLLESTESGTTPLEQQLELLGRQLSVLTVIICAIVTGVGIWQQQNLVLMIETGIALAVAAIPEGLPVLATLALAVGTQRMVRNRAILRHLAAVETLGCTSIICSDKTGTLTENQMTTRRVYVKSRDIDVSGTGYIPDGEFLENGKCISSSQRVYVPDPAGATVARDPVRHLRNDVVLRELVLASVLCNDAKLENHGESGWHVHGDPTEGALLVMAEKTGIDVPQKLADYPRIAEFPFDLSRKRMSTIHQTEEGKIRVYTKGAPEVVFAHCHNYLTDSGEEELDQDTLKEFTQMNEQFSRQGLRVLAVAYKSVSSMPCCFDQDELEADLTLIGLLGLKDPPREGVKEAVQACKQAGIKVVMITGDQALTAAAIAKELGIIEEGSDEVEVVTGEQLQEMTDEKARACLNETRVLAGIKPELKLAIVKHLQETGAIVSMTGDGVNDAPALKQANIGVAMGEKGTDLARSVSQMVITDDRFGTIVKAIEQGRITYSNIQRAVGYLLTASLASVITVALGIFCDLGLALSPLQLLWLNLIMHIFPGLGIVLQKASSSVMDEKPRDPRAKIIGKAQQIEIWTRSILVSIAVLFAIAHAEKISHDPAHTSTIGLCTLSLCLLFQAWSWLGAEDKSTGSKAQKVEVGRAMIINMILAYLLLFAALYAPGLTAVLGIVPLNAQEFAFSFVISVISVLLILGLRRLQNLFH